MASVSASWPSSEGSRLRAIASRWMSRSGKLLNAWCELQVEDLSGRCPRARVGLPPHPTGKGTDPHARFGHLPHRTLRHRRRSLPVSELPTATPRTTSLPLPERGNRPLYLRPLGPI